jgi:hypothetical protein
MEALHLFKHLKGHKVYCSTVAGKEIEQIIDSVTHIPADNFLTITFESGIETQIKMEWFDRYLESGAVNYMSVKENVAMTLKDRE